MRIPAAGRFKTNYKRCRRGRDKKNELPHPSVSKGGALALLLCDIVAAMREGSACGRRLDRKSTVISKYILVSGWGQFSGDANIEKTLRDELSKRKRMFKVKNQ